MSGVLFTRNGFGWGMSEIFVSFERYFVAAFKLGFRMNPNGDSALFDRLVLFVRFGIFG